MGKKRQRLGSFEENAHMVSLKKSRLSRLQGDRKRWMPENKLQEALLMIMFRYLPAILPYQLLKSMLKYKLPGSVM